MKFSPAGLGIHIIVAELQCLTSKEKNRYIYVNIKILQAMPLEEEAYRFFFIFFLG